jgi:succinate dehydrogenase/fumarate reductase-like Fe-S protein
MKKYINVNIFRYDPDTDDAPYFKSYQVKALEEVSVLVLLDRIQKEQDQTLSFRSYCCGLQNCRSCRMKINQKPLFACLTIIKPGEEITVEPLSFPGRHIKDLVVDAKE